MRMLRRTIRTGIAFVTAIGAASCTRAPVLPRGASPLVIRRPVAAHTYRFTSTETTPAGSHTLRVTFRLDTRPDGTEDATLRLLERDVSGVFHPVTIDMRCVAKMGGSRSTLAVLHISPPPRDIRRLIDGCAPEDLFGAATDILPLLMIQAQPKFRATELRRVGERLPFGGYVTGWQSPPGTIDARIVADSGFSRLDSLLIDRMTISWDTSPMTVDIVRMLAPGQQALFHGREWFAAEVAVDPRTGELLDARTRADSLVLSLVTPYTGTVVPSLPFGTPAAAPVVRITRLLKLERVP